MALKIARPYRCVAAVLVGSIVAGCLFLQAASSTLSRNNPAVALDLWPMNGVAAENQAYQLFTSAIEDPERLSQAAMAAAPMAGQAIIQSPLSPKAYAILALGQSDAAQRGRTLDAASAINRRDLTLQGLMLEEHLKKEDYAGSLTTLDYLMRVHPKLTSNFFPILDKAFMAPSTLPEFNKILNGTSIWHAQFLDPVRVDDALLPNMARFRNAYRQPEEIFDRELIRRLAQAGNYDLAASVFKTIPQAASSSAVKIGTLPWSDNYPPMDWLFVDEGDIRAQRALSGTDLDVYAKSGSGGVVAQRVIQPKGDTILMTAQHDLQLGGGREIARIQLQCAEASAPFFDQPLRSQSERIRADISSANCKTMLLKLTIRSWSGEPAVRGTFKPLIVTGAN